MDAASVVRQVLDQSGLSKTRLSALSGVSRSLLDAYLKGDTQPSVAQVSRLADAAGLRLDITVRPRAERTLPEEFIAVLEFGELFPRPEEPRPLVNLGPVWGRIRERTSA